MDLILCYPCGEFVEYDEETDSPGCEHSESEATETDLSGHDLNRAKLEALGKELDRAEPRVAKAILQSEFVGLAARTPTTEAQEAEIAGKGDR